MLIYMKNLTKRNGHWAYRKVVPADLRDLVGITAWTHSFTGLSELQAAQKAKQLNERYAEQIQSLRSGGSLAALKKFAEDFVRRNPEVLDTRYPDDDPRNPSPSEVFIEQLTEDYAKIVATAGGEWRTVVNPPATVSAIVNTIQNKGKFTPQKHPISVAYGYYRDERFNGEDDKPSKIALTSFIELHGDIDLAQIRRAHVAEWIKHSKDKKGHSGETIKRRLGALSAMTRTYLRNMEIEGVSNPFSAHKITMKSAVEARVPFHHEHLEKIKEHLKKSDASRETKIQIQLMMATGTGPKEIAGITWSDVALKEKIPYIWIRKNELRRLKTKERDRKMPLLSYAVDALSGLSVGKPEQCIWGKYPDPNSLSAKLNKFLRAAGVPKTSRLCAYSFRHTLEEALRVSEASYDIQQAILGHARKGMTERYGAPQKKLETLLAALKTAQGVMGDVSRDNYRQGELEAHEKVSGP